MDHANIYEFHGMTQTTYF